MDFSKLRTSASNRVLQGVSRVTPLSDKGFRGNTPPKTGCYEVFSDSDILDTKHPLHPVEQKVFLTKPNDINWLTPETPTTPNYNQTRLVDDDYLRLMAWLESIDETDDSLIQQVVHRCLEDPNALSYFMNRAAEISDNKNVLRTVF